ncbi:hypothetical protein NKH16_23820 [Mesorhizobium sp. M1307]|uniref:hypothetical protein n=1 Tax=Mesorhizobium sp. M1307 TaxID=2957079 RepID=UPI0033375299
MDFRIAEETTPDNSRAKLYWLLERLDLVRSQIHSIEGDRLLVASGGRPSAGNDPILMAQTLALGRKLLIVGTTSKLGFACAGSSTTVS